jgi:hypothetical protein
MPAALEDSVEFTTGGLLRINIAGTKITLRRPRIGELADLTEAWNEIIAFAHPQANADEEVEVPADEELRARIVEWYRLAVGTLADKPKELPAEDRDLPVWMQQSDVARELLSEGGWRGTPWVAGARPSERVASATQEQLAGFSKMAPQLAELVKMLPELRKQQSNGSEQPSIAL